MKVVVEADKVGICFRVCGGRVQIAVKSKVTRRTNICFITADIKPDQIWLLDSFQSSFHASSPARRISTRTAAQDWTGCVDVVDVDERDEGLQAHLL